MREPLLSYVLVTDRYETIRRVVHCLQAQTDRAHVEVVIVLPHEAVAEVREALPDEFPAVRLAGVDTIRPMGAARAAGVRAATGATVFLGETHSFPRPSFAEAMLAASSGDWDVFVPALENANPASGISWSNFLMDYGSWNEDMTVGAIPGGPTWNVAYRRDVLMAHDTQLARMLTHGDDLAVALQAERRRVLAVPSAVIGHANVSRAGWWFEQRFLAGALVAESRRQRWSRARTWLQVVASPAIPPLLLSRLGPAVRAGAHRGMPWTTYPALVVGTCFRTLGEVVASLRGAGGAAQDRMDEYELHKLEYTELSY